MNYSADMHKDIEAINDMTVALNARLKAFHDNYGCLDKFSADYCDTINLNLFADDLDSFQADEIEHILTECREAWEEENAEPDTMEADESSMLQFYQAGVR